MSSFFQNMKQNSFSQFEYSQKKRVTQRERFLAEIERVTPWKILLADIATYYPKGQGAGRPQRGLKTMLRMYVVQQCFNLSDEATENAVYDSMAIRNFVGIDLGKEEAPDATTLLQFRRLLGKHTNKAFKKSEALMKIPLVFLTLYMSLCQAKNLPEINNLISSGKNEVRRQLNDPTSARFKNLKVTESIENKQRKRTLCGNFNAKNRYGGYGEYRLFYVNFDSRNKAINVWLQPDEDNKTSDDDDELNPESVKYFIEMS